MKIVPFPLEKLMRLHREEDVKVSLGSAKAARVALRLVTDARAVFNSSRHLHMDGVLAMRACISLASGAWIRDYRTSTAACRTCTRDGKEALLVANLPSSLALVAGGRAARARRAGAVAVDANLQPANLDIGVLAEDGIRKLDRQVVAQILPALNPRSFAPSPS